METNEHNQDAREQHAEAATPPTEDNNDCFLIMPITDPEGYEKGHFRQVSDDLFKPACEAAELQPLRGDDVVSTNLIHLEILERLVGSSMAICDLSSRNPNVLFELGLRQAFDKPVVIVQEEGTPKIFDIAPLRIVEYRKAFRYREVLEDQKRIADALRETQQAQAVGEGVNSMVRLLSLSKVTLQVFPQGSAEHELLSMLKAEMRQTRSELRELMLRADIGHARAVVANSISGSASPTDQGWDSWAKSETRVKTNLADIEDVRYQWNEGNILAMDADHKLQDCRRGVILEMESGLISESWGKALLANIDEALKAIHLPPEAAEE